MTVLKTAYSYWIFNGESGTFDKNKLRSKTHFKQCRDCYRLNYIDSECPKKRKVCKYRRLANHEIENAETRMTQVNTNLCYIVDNIQVIIKRKAWSQINDDFFKLLHSDGVKVSDYSLLHLSLITDFGTCHNPKCKQKQVQYRTKIGHCANIKRKQNDYNLSNKTESQIKNLTKKLSIKICILDCEKVFQTNETFKFSFQLQQRTLK
ncbi:hypothetical protein RFI_01226, partial [Reticulomyxa filosa]